MIMASLLQYPAEHLPAPWIIVSGCEASRWTTTRKSFSFKAPKRYVGVSLWNSQREHYYWTLLFFTSQKFQQTCPWLRSNEITKAMKTEYWLESGSLPLPLEWKQGAEDVLGVKPCPRSSTRAFCVLIKYPLKTLHVLFSSLLLYFLVSIPNRRARSPFSGRFYLMEMFFQDLSNFLSDTCKL